MGTTRAEEIEAKARKEAKAEDILKILSIRGIQVEEEIRARILSCADLPTLDLWLARAVTSTSALAVVEEPPPEVTPKEDCSKDD
jgi:hypothetical protein